MALAAVGLKQTFTKMNRSGKCGFTEIWNSIVPAVACTLLFGSSYSSFTCSMSSSGTSWVFSACQMASWEHGQMPFQGRERQHAGAFCSLYASQIGAGWSELRQLSHSSLL